MNTETKQCQNCKKSFIIESDDLIFYDKVHTPAPTFCPDCRLQRRLMFLNERHLYKRNCDLCKKDIITMFKPNSGHTVYCNTCWWSDNWDATSYGMDYDPSKPFFQQYKELQQKVPFPALLVESPTLVGSDYINNAGHVKNSYLIYDVVFAENMYYASTIDHGKDAMDVLIFISSEASYESINIRKSSRVFYSEDCSDSHNIYFSKNLSGCSDCFGCVNLRNKQYHIFNEPHSKEEYQAKLKAFQLDKHSYILALQEQARAFWQTQPHKYMRGTHNVNTTGDYVYNSKNAQFMYQCDGVEDGKYCQKLSTKPSKDVYDYTIWGMNAERIYESIVVGEGATDVKFSFASYGGNTLNVQYAMFCNSSMDIFGCASLRKKQYCILNKQYTEDEYKILIEQIKQEMQTNPYVDAHSRTWTFGEFFPYDLSLFDYNETNAIEYYPLTQEQTIEKGWRWYEAEPSPHTPNIQIKDLPDSINDAQDTITKGIIACPDCNKPFRILPNELNLLKQWGLPLPRQCPNCRHMRRFKRLNPPQLWKRNCSSCNADIQTSYSSQRLEQILCEQCYQAEVV